MATPVVVVETMKTPSLSKRLMKRDDSQTLVAGISEAMRKVGIRRDAVFVKSTASAKKVYAYFVLPSDTSKIVRESEDGTRTLGRFSNGRFRPIKVKKA